MMNAFLQNVLFSEIWVSRAMFNILDRYISNTTTTKFRQFVCNMHIAHNFVNNPVINLNTMILLYLIFWAFHFSKSLSKFINY